MSRYPALLFAALLTASSLAAESDVKIERIFGPELPGRYKHPASMTELANGDLYLAYYGGSGEYATDTADFGARKKKWENQWSEPKAIADTPFQADGNPVIWQAPDGLVWLFYLTRYGDTWSQSRIKAKLSFDNANTWSDPIMMTFELGTMVRNHPIVLTDGNYLLPIYHETGNDPEVVGAESTSLFLRIDPKKMTWTESSRIKSRIGNIQPAVVQMDENYLIAYCRRAGDYEPTTKEYMVRSESHDGGKTWSEGRETKIPNPNSAVEFIKLKNGHLMMVYNDSFNERTPLTVAISTDGDKTYPYKRNIIDQPNGDFGYPCAIETQDGKIHVVFTSDERTVVNEAVFDEKAITGKADVGKQK